MNKRSIFENKVSLRRSLRYIKEAKRVLEADENEISFEDLTEDEEKDYPSYDEVNEDDELDEDELFEEGDKPSSEKKMTEEELKIESLKIATNIAKLMSDVTPNDIMSISSTVADFIRNHEIGSGEDLNFNTDNSSEPANDEDEEDDFAGLDDEDTNEEEKEEEGKE